MTGKPQNGAFQKFVAVPEISAARIPSKTTFSEASVLPLAISTASSGLFQPDYLELPYPTVSQSGSTPSSDKVIVVWGGSSSVGTTALQLCRASGVETITTASKHNHDYCKGLGASHVIDHNSSSAVDDVVAAIKSSGKSFAGVFDTISVPDTVKAGVAILQEAGGLKRLVTTLPGSDKGLPEDIKANAVFATTIFTKHAEVGQAVWGKFVPEALESGALKPLPEPLVIGKGLENVQKGLDKNKEGVSAKKVVVEL